MTTSESTFSPQWPNRIEQAIQRIGFSSLTELLNDSLSRPYQEIADRLGHVAPIQIVAIQFQEARSSGRVRDAAKDSLCRHLVEQLPNGWGFAENSEWRTIMALSGWQSEIEVTGRYPKLNSTLRNIAKSLRKLPPPQGWLPLSPDDRFITKAFDLHWPIDLDKSELNARQ